MGFKSTEPIGFVCQYSFTTQIAQWESHRWKQPQETYTMVGKTCK